MKFRSLYRHAKIALYLSSFSSLLHSNRVSVNIEESGGNQHPPTGAILCDRLLAVNCGGNSASAFTSSVRFDTKLPAYGRIAVSIELPVLGVFRSLPHFVILGGIRDIQRSIYDELRPSGPSPVCRISTPVRPFRLRNRILIICELHTEILKLN